MLILVRHGESVGNADGRILGRHLGALDAAELDHWVSVLANTAR